MTMQLVRGAIHKLKLRSFWKVQNSVDFDKFPYLLNFANFFELLLSLSVNYT